jgi:NAD(P)-dependent dehydrogenase (short-subunit alcohol dehydrogenase family)
MMSTTTQTILVTGGNSGFGRLIVETLARQKANVFVGMRDPGGKNAQAATELRALAEQEHLALDIVSLDITDDTSVQQAIEYVIQKGKRLDVVVNNAGVSYTGPLETFTITQVQQQFETNVFGVWRVNHAAIPYMRAQKSGLLLQIGSIVGRIAFPFMGLYGSTKFALEGLTESYRYELAPFGIDAVIIEPGTYPTTISKNRVASEDSERLAPYAQAIGTFMTPFFAENRSATPPNPQEVADAVAHLVAQPAGTRPLRTIVATASQSSYPQEINTTAERATREYLESLGVLPLVTLVEKE